MPTDFVTVNALLPDNDYDIRYFSSENVVGDPVDGYFEPPIRQNRHVLIDIMASGGFVNYDKEWWHFYLPNPSYTDTYFNFPVGNEPQHYKQSGDQ